MKDILLEKHEMYEVFGVLDALQIRIEASLYSKESPEEGNSESMKSGCAQHLLQTFGRDSLSNSECDKVLKEVHKNYMSLAKEVLKVLEEEEPMIPYINGNSIAA